MEAQRVHDELVLGAFIDFEFSQQIKAPYISLKTREGREIRELNRAELDELVRKGIVKQVGSNEGRCLFVGC